MAKKLPHAIQEHVNLENFRYFLLSGSHTTGVVVVSDREECDRCITAGLQEMNFVKFSMLHLVPCNNAAATALPQEDTQPTPQEETQPTPQVQTQPTEVGDKFSCKRTVGELYDFFSDREAVDNEAVGIKKPDKVKLLDRAHEVIGARYLNLPRQNVFKDPNSRAQLKALSKQLKSAASNQNVNTPIITVAVNFNNLNQFPDTIDRPNPYMLAVPEQA